MLFSCPHSLALPGLRHETTSPTRYPGQRDPSTSARARGSHSILLGGPRSPIFFSSSRPQNPLPAILKATRHSSDAKHHKTCISQPSSSSPNHLGCSTAVPGRRTGTRSLSCRHSRPLFFTTFSVDSSSGPAGQSSLAIHLKRPNSVPPQRPAIPLLPGGTAYDFPCSPLLCWHCPSQPQRAYWFLKRRFALPSHPSVIPSRLQPLALRSPPPHVKYSHGGQFSIRQFSHNPDPRSRIRRDQGDITNNASSKHSRSVAATTSADAHG